MSNIRRQVAKSSLGTKAAAAARASVPTRDAARVVARSAAIRSTQTGGKKVRGSAPRNGNDRI